MVQRRHDAPFMGGAHVFPGGAVDEADRNILDQEWCDGLDHAARHLPDMSRPDAAAYHVAAVRELFEEAGLLLARDPAGQLITFEASHVHERFRKYRADVHRGQPLKDVVQREGLRLALDALTVCAHWVTPVGDTRRFDTWFFMTRAPVGQLPLHDEKETTSSLWITPEEALAASGRDEIVLPPPTWITLRDLEPFASVDDALMWARRITVERRQPTLTATGHTRTLVMPDGTRFVWAGGQWRPAS